MKVLNLAIISTGRIAATQLGPALAEVPGARLWSVMSRKRETAAGFAVRFGAAAASPACERIDELVADPELDGVIIASPDRLHAEYAIAAAKAGKHVLCEKPMATAAKDAAAMVEAADRAGVVLGVAFHLRWHDGHRKVARMVHRGALGEPRYARALWSWQAADDGNWRARPEVGRWWSLAGVGTHCLDMIRWMLGPGSGEVTGIQAITDSSVWHSPHDETALVNLKFASGAAAQFCTSVLFQSRSRFELMLSAGSVICDGTLGPHGGGAIVVNDEPLSFDVRNPYVGEIRNFVDAVNGDAAIEVDGVEGLRNVELLIEATASAERTDAGG